MARYRSTSAGAGCANAVMIERHQTPTPISSFVLVMANFQFNWSQLANSPRGKQGKESPVGHPASTVSRQQSSAAFLSPCRCVARQAKKVQLGGAVGPWVYSCRAILVSAAKSLVPLKIERPPRAIWWRRCYIALKVLFSNCNRNLSMRSILNSLQCVGLTLITVLAFSIAAIAQNTAC